MKKLLFLILLLSVGKLIAQQTDYIIDFNDYNAGNLHGQDGWITFKETQGNNDFEVGDIVGSLPSADGTKAIIFKYGGPGVGRVGTRKPSPNFDFSFKNGGLRTFEFDVHGCWWGIWACLGYDKNGNGKMTPNQGNTEPDEGGLIVAYGGYNFPAQCYVQLPNGSKINFTIFNETVERWARLRLTLDLDANNGEGAVTMEMKQDLESGNDWQPISEVQGLNMQLTPGSGDKNDPEVWDAISFQVQGATGGFDNLLFSKPSASFQYISFSSVPDKLTTDQPFPLSATSSSGLPVSFSIVSGPASVNGNTVTLTGEKGFVTVRASQAGNGDFDPAADVDVTFEVVDPSEFPPLTDLRTPVNEALVSVPGTLSPILLAAYAEVEHADLLSVEKIDFIIGNETITAKNWGNGYFTAWWQPPAYQQFNMEVKAFNSEGFSTSSTSAFEVVNTAQDITATTFDHAHLLLGNGVKDTFFVLPAHMGAYDKIIGKLKITCPGGGCDPWDRISSIKVKSHQGTWVELIRYITPYGVPCNHEIDLSDFFPILQGKVQMRCELTTFAQGFEYTLDLEYKAGTPAHRYGKVDVLWKGTYDFGNMANLQPAEVFNITYPANAVASTLKLVSTGHGWGENNTGNAAEFHEDTHHIRINGQNAFDQHNWWKCNPNPDGCSPQNGTWYYDRAGWCPGTIAQWFDFDMTPYVNPANSIEVRYIFDEDYKDLCSVHNPNCISGITCPNCEDSSNPILEVWANLITFSDSPVEDINSTTQEPLAEEGAVFVSPNPSEGHFKVQFRRSLPPAVCRVFNAAGQTVFLKKLPAREWGDMLDLDLSNLPAGVYFLSIHSAEGRVFKKLLVH